MGYWISPVIQFQNLPFPPTTRNQNRGVAVMGYFLRFLRILHLPEIIVLLSLRWLLW